MARKDASVAELTKNFEDSAAVLLTEYRGLTVAELKELRNTIRQDAEYAVVKNTLTKIAAQRAGVEGLDDELKGPSAIAFVHGDPVADQHRVLHRARRDHEHLQQEHAQERGCDQRADDDDRGLAQETEDAAAVLLAGLTLSHGVLGRGADQRSRFSLILAALPRRPRR